MVDVDAQALHVAQRRGGHPRGDEDLDGLVHLRDLAPPKLPKPQAFRRRKTDLEASGRCQNPPQVLGAGFPWTTEEGEEGEGEWEGRFNPVQPVFCLFCFVFFVFSPEVLRKYILDFSGRQTEIRGTVPSV